MLLYAALLFNFTDMKKNYFPLVVCHSLLSSLSMTSSSQSWQYGAIYQKAQRQNSCEIIFLMCKQPQCACLSFSHAHTPLFSERFKICWELGTHLGWMQLLNKTTLTLSDKPFLATPQFNSLQIDKKSSERAVEAIERRSPRSTASPSLSSLQRYSYCSNSQPKAV